MNIWKRLQSETPPLFKLLIKIFITLGSIGTALLAVPAMLAAMTPPVIVPIPEIVNTIAGYMIAVGAFGALISKLPIQDKP